MMPSLSSSYRFKLSDQEQLFMYDTIHEVIATAANGFAYHEKDDNYKLFNMANSYSHFVAGDEDQAYVEWLLHTIQSYDTYSPYAKRTLVMDWLQSVLVSMRIAPMMTLRCNLTNNMVTTGQLEKMLTTAGMRYAKSDPTPNDPAVTYEYDSMRGYARKLEHTLQVSPVYVHLTTYLNILMPTYKHRRAGQVPIIGKKRQEGDLQALCDYLNRQFGGALLGSFKVFDEGLKAKSGGQDVVRLGYTAEIRKTDIHTCRELWTVVAAGDEAFYQAKDTIDMFLRP
jgi:hypothetical protein